jgi:LuxR family maltose regulon positive regulatory protein
MEQAIERYGQDGSAPLRARALLMLARALCEAGQDKEASGALSRSLAIGKPLSLRQSYRMAGSSIARLLRAQLGQASDDSYLRELLGEARQTEAEEPASQENKITVGSLSDRERDVLTLVGRGMSNKEISRALRIGPETVKWHLKNSFVKLDVASRMQAVNRARGLALIR